MGGPNVYNPGVTPIRFAERRAETVASEERAPLSYWLLLMFLFLLYANLPLVMPATEVIRPAASIGGLALVMLLVETSQGSRKLSFSWPEGALLLAFLGAGALSCLTALWPRQAAESLSDLVKMSLVYFFISNCANTERRLRGVMWTVVVCGLIPAVGTLRNYMQGNLREGRAEWIGIFGNPNELAYSLIVLIPLAFVLMEGSGFLKRAALTGIIAVFLPAIFVTFSRGGLVALAIVVAFYVWRKRSFWMYVALVAAVAVALGSGGKYWSRGEDFSGLKGDVSFRQRFATSEAGLEMFADHPLFGVGLGCSVIAWPLYAPKDSVLENGAGGSQYRDSATRRNRRSWLSFVCAVHRLRHLSRAQAGAKRQPA